METYPKVSVIIPVYNTEKYLRQCLDSVVNQTLKEIEIICVDDGSTDGSLGILREYAAGDPRVVVAEQKNEGAGAARNKGMDMAKGEYIHFLDSDDYLAKDAYEVMYSNAARFDAELIKTKAYCVDEETGEQSENRLNGLQSLNKRDFDHVTNFAEMPENFARNISVVPWNGLYKKLFLDAHGIRFNSLKCVNDRSFYNHVAIKAKRVVLLAARTVYHRINIATSLVGQRAKHFDCHFESYRIIENQCRELPDKQKAIVLSAELGDIFAWYNKYKADEELGAKIAEQMKCFLGTVDLNFFVRNKVKTPWKRYWDELMAGEDTCPEEEWQGPKVSVIIPVYNGEEFLRPCLDSVVNQTLSSIEVICVDDGSTDGTMDILREYEERDARVTVLSQENINAGAARNRGLAVAKGKYLSFLDADDFFEPDMLEKAYARAEICRAQITVFGSDQYIQETGKYKAMGWTVKKAMLPLVPVFSANEIRQDRFRVFIGWAWDKLFRRDFIENAQLKFQEQRTTNDMYFVFSAIIRAERICVLEDILVHQRRQGDGTLSVTRERSWHCFYDALQRVKAQMQEWGYWNWIEQDFVNYAAHAVLWSLAGLQEQTQRLLYQKLNDRWFFDLGITTKPRNYFYDQQDYQTIMRIASSSYEQFYAKGGTVIREERGAVKQRPKVSVIMPSLNVGEYIRECIESVINQTLEEIEIICVDAGSTDGTWETLKEYAERDERVKLIHSEKRSYGHQMNLGLDAATGEYIGIVETDDFIKLDMYERQYTLARELELDFVKADFYRFAHAEDTGELELDYSQLSKDMSIYGKVLNPQEDVELFKPIMNIWSGIYDLNFVRRNGIRFNETPGASYQDNGFFFQTFALATRIYFMNTPYYMNRRDNPNSSVYSKEKVYCMNEEYAYIREFLDRNPEIRERLMPIYYLKKYRAYMFTYKRIAEEFKLEYIVQFRKEFIEAKEAGHLERSLFNKGEWNNVTIILKDVLKFYLENSNYKVPNGKPVSKAANPAVKNETALAKNTELQAQVAGLQKEIQNIRRSATYKIGRVITFVPRKARGLVWCIQDNGLLYTLCRVKEKLLARFGKR